MFSKNFLIIASIFTINFGHASNIDLLWKQVKMELPKTEGWCSEEKASAMFQLVLETKPEVCVEIGVFGGASVLPVAMALSHLKKGVIYAIDPWENKECTKNYEENNANYQWWDKVDLNYIYRSFQAILEKFSLGSYCTTLKETSETALNKIPEVIDILHVDGNHSEENSYFDVTHYFPKVRKGGFIFFDDALWGTTGKALAFVKERSEFISSFDKGNCLLFKKT